MPINVRNKVDFPIPFAPINAINSPFFKVKLKGGCCEICGYKKNLTALTFHHINPDKKLFNVEMRNIANYNWNKVLKEADQCQLLCHNCHHELHHPEFNLKKLLTDNQN